MTGKSKNTNWGMGLFYTNRIVRQHFGRLKMESRVGKGSTFMILLPALQDEKIKQELYNLLLRIVIEVLI